MSVTSLSSLGSATTQRRRTLKEAPLTVAGVYDIASDIGKEFEVLIDSHGPEHVTGLMQKVISALEHLEKLSGEKEKENQIVENLKLAINRLELEDNKRCQERHRHDKEMEHIEEYYKEETRDLLSTVKRLQDENRKLALSLASVNERDSAFSEDDESYLKIDLVNKLEDVIEKQRSQMKSLDQMVLDCKSSNEELKCQNESLTSCTWDLRRKLCSAQTQINVLVNERADLTAKVHELHREVQGLNQRLGTVSKDYEDLAVSNETKSKKNDNEYDPTDPNKPIFSLDELRDILQERNSLKARVSDLEDELSVFRPRPIPELSPSSSRLTVSSQLMAKQCKCSYHSKMNHEESVEVDEIECEENPDPEVADFPIHGPLPQDPSDAPWRREDSRIRKLFLFITSRVVNVVASAEHEIPATLTNPTPSL